ncbi:hypothetical protein [Paenibacillus abyssi]|uniref:Uncharacterized protein n=1 Tax=Paenibacillus abyssi TaxID=1340531 RepID=A0A917FK41_9BACL|nr:hypothetical protein [Paenibacillus abyssi]GGF88548.1 hypothetical protein GCM10010916_02370 [Paenibacillus abyssi]
MREDVRQVFGKVEITYSDPFIDTSLAVASNQAARLTYPTQLINEIDAPSYKYFSLHNNVLDGSFHTLPDSAGEAEVGVWGTTLSGAAGDLGAAFVITMTFDPRPVYTLKLVGDLFLNDYPVDFTVKMYQPGDLLVHTETVTGNANALWTRNIVPIGNIVKIEITVTRINNVGSVAKVTECYTGVKEEYGGDDRLMEIDLIEEQVFDDMTLPIGNVSANEIDIQFDNVDKHFDPRNPDSPLFGQLKKNRRARAWLGVDLNDNGDITWYPLGTFWTTEWKAPTSGTYASTTARDRLELLKQKDFTVSTVYTDYSLYQLAEIVLQDFGIATSDYVIDPALQDVVIPYAWFERMSHRAALTKIAAAGLARLYCDRNGKIRMEVQRPTGPAVFSFTEDETIYSADYPYAAGQTVNYIETESSPREIGAPGTVLRSIETITVPANGTVTKTFVFNKLPCLNVSAPVIVSSGAVTVQSFTAYAWGVDVTFANAEAVDHTITNVEATGQTLEVVGGTIAVAQDAPSIRDNGKLAYNVANDFIQTTTRAQQISDNLIATYKDPRHDIEMDTRGHVSVQVGDKISAPAFEVGQTADYYIVRQNVKWNGALSATIKGVKA